MQKVVVIFLIAISVSFLFTNISNAQLSGALSGTYGPGIYTVIGVIYVNSGDSLTLLPGTQFEFDENTIFIINGYLNAEGTESDSIIFKKSDTANGWLGIQFYDTADSTSNFTYCVVKHSVQSGIRIEGTTIEITRCTVSQNANHLPAYGGGILVNGGGSGIISFCTITGNQADFGGGVGVGFDNSNHVTLSNCDISHNQAEHGGGMHLWDGTAKILSSQITSNSGSGIDSEQWVDDVLVQDCYVADNTSLDDVGGIALINHATIKNCVVENNVGGIGGGIVAVYDGLIDRCLIANNSTQSLGGGITCYECTITNCTIVGNETQSNGGGIYLGHWAYDKYVSNCIIANNQNGGIYIHHDYVTYLSHNEFYGNTPQNIMNAVPAGAGILDRTNLNGDSCDVYYNIFMDPQFYSTSGDSAFYLSEGSPCIDAGDPDSLYDPDGTITDIGKFYSDQSGILDTIDGYCYLEGSENHSGTQVTFESLTFPTYTDSSLTDSSGYFSINLHRGFYQLTYRHEGYLDVVIPDVVFHSDSSLADTTLLAMTGTFLSGSLNGEYPAGIYFVEDQITVPFGNTVIFTGGTMLYFSGNFGLEIAGNLQALGSEQDSVSFISLYAGSGWTGLDFVETASDSCQLEYCRIEGSSESGIEVFSPFIIMDHCRIENNSTSLDGGGVKLINSSAAIDYCDISGNEASGFGGGLYLLNCLETQLNGCSIRENSTLLQDGGGICINSGSEISLTSCMIEENSSQEIHSGGGGGYVINSHPDLDNCTFSNNSSNGDLGNCGGGGLFLEESSASFLNCLFTGNSSLKDGGGVLSYDGDPIFDDCVFETNYSFQDGGGLFSWNGDPIFDDCVFEGNYSLADGGGMNIYSSTSLMNNCDFVNNIAGMSGAGLYCLNCTNSIINCIFEGNQSVYPAISFPSSGGSTVEYCDFYDNLVANFSGAVPPNIGVLSQTNANGDSCDVYNNIFMDPLFFSTSGDSAWRLTELSPCIDAGDPLNPLDPDSTIADMGAYYFDQGLGITQDSFIEIPDEFCLFPAYPNPFNPSTTIRFGLPVASQVNLTIYNIRGERVADLVDGYRLPGYHSVTWKAGGLASGMYFCRIEVGEFNAIRKVMLVK